MRKNTVFCVLLAVVFQLFCVAGCNKDDTNAPEQSSYPVFTSYSNIPGVTEEESAAVENLRRKTDAFIYGMSLSSETFHDNARGRISGYSALLCDWLTKLFGIPFKPRIYEWGDLIAGLESGEISFTGELTATEERRKVYFMTDPVAERAVKAMSIVNSKTAYDTAKDRPPRYAFLKDTTTPTLVSPFIERDSQIFFIDDYGTAYNMLKSGQIDAFFDEGVAEAAFDIYDDVTAKDFFPHIFGPVSFATQNPELAPIVSIVQKALQNGGTQYLNALYNAGQRQYMAHKLLMRLNAEEKAYIRDHIASGRAIPFAAEYDNYPVCFYNSREEQWQGIAVDVLREVSALTGLSFRRVHDERIEWPRLMEMLENGEVSMILELIRTTERSGHFLWAENPMQIDYYAMLSKAELKDISINEILYSHVGLIQKTAYAELFREWFPGHAHTMEYTNLDEALEALEKGDIHLLMGTQNMQRFLMNYREQPGYKSNIIFKRSYAASFGYNLKEEMLKSIVDKALRIIDTDAAAERWTRKTFDYRSKMVRTQIPWLIGVSGLLTCVLILLGIVFHRKRQEGKRLERIVQERTAAIVRQGELLRAVNDASTVMLTSDFDDLQGSLDGGIEMIARCADVDRIYIWQNAEWQDGTSFSYRRIYEWVADGVPGRGDATEFSYGESPPEWAKSLSEGKCMNGPIDNLPESERSRLARYRIQSVLAVPVFLEDAFRGFAVFDDCRRKRSFSAEEESVLRSGSLLIVNAVLRNEMAQNLRNTVAKLEAVIANYSGVIWSVDKEGIVTTFNGLYLKKIGVTPSFIEGKKLEAAARKNRHADIIAHVKETFDSGQSQEWTGDIDGGVFRSHTTAVYDEEGGITGVVGSTDDISATIRLQRELEVAVEAANAASRAKGNFLANMSHEIRTPMNAIIGMTAIAKSSLDPDRKDYCLNKIENACAHLLGVINDILDMSKIEANKLELSPVPFSFERMLQNVVNVVNFRVDEKQQSFQVRIDPEIPHALVGDDQRLAQVITNLLGNAVKFTPEHGVIRLDTCLAGEENGLFVIRITVSDTGIGISKEQQFRLFNSFEQADSDTSRKFGGTGLGLAISKRIVEMMGGDIRVESELGNGSTFTFTVRLKRDDEAERPARFRPGVRPGNLRILVVDDDSAVREYFAEIIRRFGLDCDTAGDGVEAVALMRQNGPYDINFVDWKMPGMNGIELTRELKARAADTSVVVMISTVQWALIEDDAKNAGVDKFLAKPLFPSAIADCINECLGLGRILPDGMGGEGAGETDSFAGRRILLVEDVEINREIVLSLLEPTKLAIDCAENGVEAVKMYGEAPLAYDAIFMDVQMPEMDGYEATRRVRALEAEAPERRHIPIIAMTANVFREDIEKSLASGMDDHLGKPLDFHDMLAILRKYLSEAA
jgi:PAS domain S-box-containing protein